MSSIVILCLCVCFFDHLKLRWQIISRQRLTKTQTWGTVTTGVCPSLVPRPFARLSLAVQNSRRGSGLVHHVMSATVVFLRHLVRARGVVTFTDGRTNKKGLANKIKTDDDLLTIARTLSHRPTPRCIRKW